MESFLFKTSSEDKSKVRNLYGVTEKDVADSVEIIRAWINQQQHLPHDAFDDNTIERFLLRNKFRLEQTKRKIESYFTLKAAYQDIFSDFENKKPSQQLLLQLPLPRNTPNGEQIVYYKIQSLEPDHSKFLELLSTSVTMGDILLRYDYSASQIIVIDLEELSLKIFKSISLPLLQKAYKLFTEAFSGRIAAIHFINAPHFVSSIITLAKIILPMKIVDRIKIHQSLETLFEDIPKELFPKDFGGLQPSLKEIAMEYDKLYEESLPMIKKNLKKVSLDHLRIKIEYNSEQFGADGSFKKLNLD